MYSSAKEDATYIPGCGYALRSEKENSPPGGVVECFRTLDELSEHAKKVGVPMYSSAKNVQIGGNHYKDMAIQPSEYIHKNKLGYMEGCVVKYVSRWRNKGGVEDLQKAKHYLELLIEMEFQG